MKMMVMDNVEGCVQLILNTNHNGIVASVIKDMLMMVKVDAENSVQRTLSGNSNGENAYAMMVG